MNPLKRIPRGERGYVMMLTAILMMLIIPTMGLAIDAVVMYTVKGKLSSAADAGAIAAAANLNVGLTLADQTAAAQARALAYFNANFPTNGWNTKNLSVNAAVAETAFRTRTVTVTASLDAPAYFMSVLGFSKTHMVTLGKASRRDVNLVLVLDRSSSMAGAPCTAMTAASVNFVNLFAEGRDRLAALTFGSSYFIFFPANTSFKTGASSLLNLLATVTCYGNTSTAEGLYRAYQIIKTINEPGALNLVVMFTDGYPNGVTADYPIRTKSDTRYGYDSGYQTWNSGTNSYSGATVCNNTGATCSMEPSPCKDASNDLFDRNNGQTTRKYTAPSWNPNWQPGDDAVNHTVRGVLSQWGGDLYNLTTGSSAGLMKWVGSSLNQGGEPSVTTAGATGCAFGSSQSAVRRDIAYMPNADAYGNNTTGTYHVVGTYPAGSGYDGKQRVDCPMCITGASFNAADNMATTMRNDATYNVVIYTIGLGANGGVDDTFLERVANDPRSPIYDSTRPTGLYKYAPTVQDLNTAFQKVASEILRIAQ